MKRMIITAILFSQTLGVPAQEKKERQIALWGHVRSSLTRSGIKDVRITLMLEDSTVVDTMRVFRQWWDGKEDYAYRFNIPAREQKYIIRAEHPDYELCDVNYHVRHIARNTYFDAPWHYLKRRSVQDYDLEGGTLGEVVVKKTRVKVFARGDTVVYNADAFNLPEGSMLDDLIKQMPGAELTSDGRILINGRQIDELTLNGKDFFGSNKKVMLKNLPLYTVNQLKVFEKSTERSQWLGREVEDKKYAMDVVLKRQYNTGLLGNATIARGTDDLWLARLFGLRYTDNSRLSLYGNTNNVNMAGKADNEGYWDDYTGNNGRTETHNAGLDLMVDDREKRFQNNFTATVDWTKNDLETETNSEQYMANGNSTFSKSNTTQIEKSLNVMVSNRFKTAHPLRSWHTHANTTFNYSTSDGESNSLAEQIGVNTNRTSSLTDSRRVSGNGDFGIWRKTSWGDDGGLNFRTNISHSKSHSQSEQHVVYPYGTNTDIHQLRYTPVGPNTNYDYAIAPYYSFNLLHGFTLYTDYTYFQQYSEQDYLTYLQDSIQTTLDTRNSNRQTSLNRTHALAVALRYNKNSERSRLKGRLYLTLRHFDKRLHYASTPVDTTITQHNTNLEPDLIVEKTWKTRADSCYQRSLRLHYNLRETLPSLLSQVAINDDQDPLHIRTGNPGLRPTLTHAFDARLNLSRRRPWAYYSIFANLNVYRNSVSQGYTYNPETGVYTYRPMNVNGNWNASLRFAFQGCFDKQSLFYYAADLIGSYSRNVAYAALAGSTASVQSHVNNWNVGPSLRLSYQKEGNAAGFTGGLNYRHATQQEGTIDNVNAASFSYGLNGQLQLTKWATIGTDLTMHSKRGYNDASLNRDELIWNATASCSLVKNKLLLKLEAYDLLHQLSNITIIIDGQGRTEAVYNTLPRYVMLSLTYRFQKFPKNKQQ